MNNIQRYNIAFLADNPMPFTQAAKALFGNIYDTYILSENSLPHITLCQFETQDPKILKDIFNETLALNINTYVPNMIGVHFKKGTKENQGFYMAQILIEREKSLIEAHFSVLEIIKKYNMKCVNSASDRYQPHLTLARIRLTNPISIWPDSILNPARFKLTLGISDPNGQYLKTLYSVNDTKPD